MNAPWSRVGYKAHKIVHEITCSHKVSKASQHHKGSTKITSGHGVYHKVHHKLSQGIQRCHNVLIADHTILVCF